MLNTWSNIIINVAWFEKNLNNYADCCAYVWFKFEIIIFKKKNVIF